MNNRYIPIQTSSGSNLLSIIEAEIEQAGGMGKLAEQIEMEWIKDIRPVFNDRDSRVFRLFRKHPDLTQKQIGQVFGIPTGTIHGILTRHMKRNNIKWRK